MELKCLVVLAVLGFASGFKLPEGNPESSFASSYSETNPSSSANAAVAPLPEDEGVTRTKRGLFFKKGKGERVVYNNRQYEHGFEAYGPRPGREVHHHHHYSQYPQAPSYGEQGWGWNPRPAPNQQEYHHYHGHNQGSSGYGNGGYGQYEGQYGGQQQGSSVGAEPAATGHNNVDRGQGAAAVNNIAIIHARAGTHAGNHAQESNDSPVDFEQLSRQALGMD